MILRPESAVLVVIDLQERLAPHIRGFARVLDRAVRLIRGFCILDVPVVITEQYRKGLGPTVPEVLAVAGGAPIVEKRAFSCCGSNEFLKAIAGRDQVLVCGTETHVCVSQTALDLLADGRQVHVAIDAVGSRTVLDRRAGLAKMQAAGAIPATCESALFELVRTSTHEQFKAISALVR